MHKDRLLWRKYRLLATESCFRKTSTLIEKIVSFVSPKDLGFRRDDLRSIVDRQLHPLDQSADFQFANQINYLYWRRYLRYSKCNHVNLEFNQIKKNMPRIVHRVLFSHRFELWLHRLWQNHFLLTRCSIQHLPNILFLLILLFFKRFINWNSSLKL